MAARIYILRCWPLSPAHCSFTIQHVIQFISRSSDTVIHVIHVIHVIQFISRSSDTGHNTLGYLSWPWPLPRISTLYSSALNTCNQRDDRDLRLKAVFADSKAWCFQRHNFFKRQIKWLKCAEWLMIIYWNCKYCSCSAAGPGGVLRTPESPASSPASSSAPPLSCTMENVKGSRSPNVLVTLLVNTPIKLLRQFAA